MFKFNSFLSSFSSASAIAIDKPHWILF